MNANVEEWANYWASAKVDAVALSVSGPVAFYPTDIPFYRRSPYLNGRDFFGECVNAAKARGIRVYGRMSPDILVKDPRGAARTPTRSGSAATATASLQSPAPDIAYTCQFGGNFSELQPAILRQLNARYDIDGVFMNGWPTEQTCYCENCRKIGDPRSAQYREAVLAECYRAHRGVQEGGDGEEPRQFLQLQSGRRAARRRSGPVEADTHGTVVHLGHPGPRQYCRSGVAGCTAGEICAHADGRSPRGSRYGQLLPQRKGSCGAMSPAIPPKPSAAWPGPPPPGASFGITGWAWSRASTRIGAGKSLAASS